MFLCLVLAVLFLFSLPLSLSLSACLIALQEESHKICPTTSGVRMCQMSPLNAPCREKDRSIQHKHINERKKEGRTHNKETKDLLLDAPLIAKT